MAIEVFKILNECVHQFYQILYKKGQVHIILDIHFFAVNTSTYGKRSLRYAAPVLWNSLPDDFRKCSNFNQFIGLI